MARQQSRSHRPALAGTRVLVTGAGRGIGAATARALAAGGARVALVGRSPGNVGEVAADIGGQARPYVADIGDLAAMRAAADAAESDFGGIDAVVANAGIAGYGSIAGIDPDAFERVIRTNLLGSFHTARATLPALRRSHGYFLSVASLAAFAPGAGFASYAASKAGLEALVDALAVENRAAGVAIGIAHPSWIDTDMLRESESDLPAFAAGRRKLPWPYNVTTDADTCARALAHAVARRSRRVYLPRSVLLIRWVRPMLAGRLAQLVAGRIVTEAIVDLEEQHRRLGRSVSTRHLPVDR
jgi:hypothetical protein